MKRIALLLCLLFTPPVTAHDYRLVPKGFNIEGGANVPVRVYVRESLKGGQEVVYSPKRTAALQLVYSGKTATEFPDLNDGGKPALAFKMPTTGIAVFRYDRDWSSLTLKADKFTAYLKEEGLDAIIQARAAANEAEGDEKERYRRCLKTIVHGCGKPDDTPTKPVSHVLEIVPGKNPYTLEAGEELPVKMLFEEQPHAGAKVTAYHRAGEVLTTATPVTDKSGAAAIKLTASATWVVQAVHMRRVADKTPTPAADWEGSGRA